MQCAGFGRDLRAVHVFGSCLSRGGASVRCLIHRWFANHGFALGGQLHDLLLRGSRRRQLAGDAASHMTRMRWLRRSTSGSSEEIIDDRASLLRERVQQLVDLALAPMSIPRVGSSKNRISQSRTSHLAITIFC